MPETSLFHLRPMLSPWEKNALFLPLHQVWKGNTYTKVFAWVSTKEIYLFLMKDVVSFQRETR